MTPLDGAPSKEEYVLDPAEIILRHIRQGTASSPGAVQVLGTYFYPDAVGLNGDQGFQSGNYERKVKEEGSFSVTFPNGPGADGVMHRDRFLVLEEEEYRPGDEFIEIWKDRELLFVGVPTAYKLSKSALVIEGVSPFWLLKLIRETTNSYWVSAPRDALEYYLSVWQEVVATDFEGFDGTYLFTTQETADGWKYIGAQPSPAGGLQLKTKLGETSPELKKLFSPTFQIGPTNPDSHESWRVEAFVNFVGIEGKLNSLTLSLWKCASITVGKNSINANVFRTVAATYVDSFSNTVRDGDHHVAIEGRDRWVYFYFDGRLVSILPQVPINFTAEYVSLAAEQSDATTAVTAQVYFVSVRRTRPFLSSAAHPGDYKLPGAPTSGGLEGHYHLDTDIPPPPSPSIWEKFGRLLHPAREIDPSTSQSGGLYQRRLDSAINFPVGESWMPPGPPGGALFSCRWVGAIYLDLANYDFAIRVQADDRARIWISKTRSGEEYLSDWTEAGHALTTTTGPWLKAGSTAASPPSGAAGKLAGMPSGHYPIVIEFSNTSSTGGIIVEYQRSDGVGTWQILGKPATATEGGNYSSPTSALVRLSPLGLYQENVQYESHYDAFQAIVEAYGYQWVETPRSLESGEFPGYVEVKNRVGRDTNVILDEFDGTEVAVQGNADEVADSIITEAQGLGDPGQATNLGLEVFNFDKAPHLFLAQAQESLGDINGESFLLQRARSMLALRREVWEEVGARPRGQRELADKFPLTGELAEFKWDPGDGVRLNFPEVKVKDKAPRQIMSLGQPFTPNGLGTPTASFRQRPRNFEQVLRKMLKQSLAQKRNYQGQLVVVSGALGGNAGPSVDAYSRVSMPINPSNIVTATLIVQTKSDTSEWTVEINGVSTAIKFQQPGRIDVTPFAKAWESVKSPRLYARGIPGTGTATVQLELLIRV